jgi:hypothetical protein
MPADTTTTEQRLRATVEHLAALERAPCSPGERAAAEWIAERLREHGASVRLDDERVHGTFFWPLGLLCGCAALAGIASLRGRRSAGLVGAAAAAAIWQDLGGDHRRWFRRLLSHGPTANVVAEIGDPEADRTLVIHAHHDAARTSFIFDQSLPRLLATRMPWLLRRMDRWPPLMGLVVAGPALVAIGAPRRSRRLSLAGTVLSAGSAAVMAHMRTQPVVPGANDNLTGVAVLIELARRLREHPLPGLRVMLVSAGAEEANQEGMLRFAERHFPDLPKSGTSFLCLDTLGSPDLVLIEGEGFLRMRDYPDEQKDLVESAARDRRVNLRRGLRFTFATDGLVPLRAGYPVASIGSLNEYMVPSNYHWPTDTADRVRYETVAGALEIAHRAAELTAQAASQ